MECLNKVTLRGRVGSVRRTKITDGKTIVRLNVITELVYKNVLGQSVVESTWHTCQAFQKDDDCDLARIEKGSAVEIEGRIRNIKYAREDGTESLSQEIVASSVNIVDEENS